MKETEERNPFYNNPYMEFVNMPDIPLPEPPAPYEADIPLPEPPPPYEADIPHPEPPAPSKPKPKFSAQRASDVADDEIKYLWKPYILRGDVTIMAAAGGTGKTFALCGIAAALSNGRYPLNPFEQFAPMTVLFISAEDPDFILRSRMQCAGADLNRIFILDASKSARLKLSDGFGQPYLADLDALIAQNKPDLVIIDPLHAFIGSSVKMTEQSVIRPFMQALATLAKKHDCAIVDVAHVSKRPAGANANDAILGATDIVNASRSVLRVIFDETGTNPNRRVIVHTKSNYAAMGMSVAFEISDDGSLLWTGFSDVTRSDLEAAARSNRSLSEHLSVQGQDRIVRTYTVDRLEALAKEQTAPKQFYSFETLRSYGISGRADILPQLPALSERGLCVQFLKEARRSERDGGKAKRGIYLIRADAEPVSSLC